MIRPTFEVADILRVQGDRFLDRYRSSFGFQQLKAFRAILRCRTAALGGHRDACPSCGHQAISYNSCRNRHCPKCQTQARERWLAARERELLTTSYFPCCVHCASRTQCAGLGEPAFVLRPAVHRQCSNLARDRHRSQTPGRRDRRDRHPAYLGTEPAPASPHSLRHSRRRTLARSPSLDPPTRSEEHTSELQSLAYLVCRLLLEKKKTTCTTDRHTLQAPIRNLRRHITVPWTASRLRFQPLSPDPPLQPIEPTERDRHELMPWTD